MQFLEMKFDVRFGILIMASNWVGGISKMREKIMKGLRI